MFIRRFHLSAVLLVFAALSSFVDSYELGLRVGSSAEWCEAETIIMHTPGQEVFLGVIHPDAALFEKPFNVRKAQQQHLKFVEKLQNQGVRVIQLTEALMRGTVNEYTMEIMKGVRLDSLREFTKQFLIFNTSGLSSEEASKQQKYHDDIISKMHPEQLVQIILQQPTVTLHSTGGFNTGYTAEYQLKPVMNMYFMRDQMITTAKGVVLSNMNSLQRQVETKIAKFALYNFGIVPLLEITGEGHLEGGDFIPAGETSFIGQGLRTNEIAVKEMLEKKVFGSKRVVVVKDPWKNQIQMHLDTFFNIINPHLAVLVADRLDVNVCDANNVCKINPANPEKRLTVDVYESKEPLADSPHAPYEKVVSDADFQEYVEKKLGFKVLPVSPENQLLYGVNFLTVKSNVLMAIDGSSQDYKDLLAKNGVSVDWMDFSEVTGGYGAAHCTTQSISRICSP
jgi:Arginine deiminase